MDYGESNGLFLNDKYLPPEIVSLILSFVNAESLYKNCSRVCKTWNIIIKENVWKIKAERKYNRKFQQFPLEMYQLICVKDPFNRNLLKNPSGKQGFKHWNIILNYGDRFKVENPPEFCASQDEVTKAKFNSCFATSYGICSKRQLIDLWKIGMTKEFLNKFKPPIYVSEWWASRRDCGCQYVLVVKLCDKNGTQELENSAEEFKVSKSVNQWEGGSWNKVEHTFRNYGPNIRYISFYHHGQDRQFWAGHYGSKMTESTVKILFPENQAVTTSNNDYSSEN